jgi:hypothetical protein
MPAKKQLIKHAGLALLSASAFVFSSVASAAPLFDAGIPAGWTAVGNAGTSGANGVVSLAPTGGSQYGWVSTANGVNGVALPGVGGSGNGTNGSTLRSTVFSAAAGDALEFNFNYVTSDGSGFADYAWARLLDASFNEVALLFTARTTPSGSIVPGFSMPAPAATLTPASVSIIGGAPSWSPLGGSSGSCYASGCGYTGWVGSSYDIASAGNYMLEFGVTNWNDTQYDSGLAFDGITVGGTPIGQVPEPMSLALLGLGMIGMGAARRRRNKAA